MAVNKTKYPYPPHKEGPVADPGGGSGGSDPPIRPEDFFAFTIIHSIKPSPASTKMYFSEPEISNLAPQITPIGGNIPHSHAYIPPNTSFYVV